MSAKELKDQTIGDAKFWLGLAAFIISKIAPYFGRKGKK